MKKFLIVLMMCVFVFGVSACDAKEKAKAPIPEQQQEVKKDEAKAPVSEQKPEAAKTSPLPSTQQKQKVAKSLVVFESSTEGVFIVNVYANDKLALSDAFTYDQLVVQLPKTLEVLFKKKEGK